MNAPSPGQESFLGGFHNAKVAGQVIGPTRRRLRREIYGNEYPEEVDPRSYLTWTELRRLVQEFRIGPGNTFVDLGCGPAGPSLWVVRETGAALTGIDLSEVSVAAAREQAQALGLADRARFKVGDMVATGLADADFDGAMSVDALWAVPDKAGAIQEVARILKPGARFVFTNWDRDRSPPGYLPPLSDHRPLLEQAGFQIEVYEVQPEAETKRRAYYEQVVVSEQAFIQEMGEETARQMILEARNTLGLADGIDYLAYSRRIFVVARRKDSGAGSASTSTD
jgi:ubiquinone/menaquinone biosynthesis C-methylase UbiE